MGRRKKPQKPEIVIFPEDKIQNLQVDYINELDLNPKYSLDVNPEGKYNMTDTEKKFVKYYIEFKSVLSAGELSGLTEDEAKQTFLKYPVQCEIKRINAAMYQRQFANKLLSLDDIGGYLSSLITNYNVPLAEQIKPSEKVEVAKLLIKLNELKNESINTPGKLIEKDLDEQLQSLSVETIKQLLETNDSKKLLQIDELNNIIKGGNKQ